MRQVYHYSLWSEGQREAQKLKWIYRFKGTFTNREIIAWGVILYAFAAVTEFHWFGWASGFVAAPLTVYLIHKPLNAHYELNKFWRKKDGK